MTGKTAVRVVAPPYRLSQVTCCRATLEFCIIAAAERDAVERVGSLEAVVPRPAERSYHAGEVGEFYLRLGFECAGHEYHIPYSVHMS